MAKAVEFFREVKQEVAKITWPSRKETTMTTMMVMLMVFFMAVILLAADAAIAELVQLVLKMGN